MAQKTKTISTIKKKKTTSKAKKHPNKHESIKKYIGQGR